MTCRSFDIQTFAWREACGGNRYEDAVPEFSPLVPVSEACDSCGATMGNGRNRCGQIEFEQCLLEQIRVWDIQSRNHPEYGGKRFPESLGYARRFIDRFGGDALKNALNESGMGNHPAFFAAFTRAGRLLAGDCLADDAVPDDLEEAW